VAGVAHPDAPLQRGRAVTARLGNHFGGRAGPETTFLQAFRVKPIMPGVPDSQTELHVVS